MLPKRTDGVFLCFPSCCINRLTMNTSLPGPTLNFPSILSAKKTLEVIPKLVDK